MSQDAVPNTYGGMAQGSHISYRQLAEDVAQSIESNPSDPNLRTTTHISWVQSDPQGRFPSGLLSDGQFVWGPNVGDFDIRAYLSKRDSGLSAFASDLELWARYSSVNPMILLSMLELRYGYVDQFPSGIDADEVREKIGTTAMHLAVAFYEHLHTWGERRTPWDLTALTIEPAVTFADGTTLQLDAEQTSGTFAIAAVLAESMDVDSWNAALFETGPGSFLGVLCFNLEKRQWQVEKRFL